MEVVILAGGWQRRFSSFMPGEIKLLAPLPGSRRFVDLLLESFNTIQVSAFHILAGSLSDSTRIAEYIGNQSTPINVISQWPPLGTAGTLREANLDLKEDFLLVNGDTLTPGLDLGHLVAHHYSILAHLTRRLGQDQISSIIGRYVTIGVDGHCMSTGRYIVGCRIPRLIALHETSLEEHLIPRLENEGRVTRVVYDSAEILDIGNETGYQRVRTLYGGDVNV